MKDYDLAMNNRTGIPEARADSIRSPGNTRQVTDINDVSLTTRYQNRTGRTLRITTRNGVSLDVHPTADLNDIGELRIFVHYQANHHVLKNTTSLLYSGINKGDKVRERYYREFKKATDNSKGTTRQLSAVVEYAVNESSMDRYNGRFYLRELDILIEDPLMSKMVHPFFEGNGIRRDFEQLIDGASDHCFMLSYRIIDNSGQRLIADRYVNIGGEVYRLPVEADQGFKDGIYVAKRNPIVTSDPTWCKSISYVHYSFEEGDKLLGLFLTAEQALAGGSTAELHKEHMAKVAAEEKVKSLEMEIKLQEMRNEINMRKLEAELELNPGKTALEWLKVAAGVGATALTLYTLWQKAKSVKADNVDQKQTKTGPKGSKQGTS